MMREREQATAEWTEEQKGQAKSDWTEEQKEQAQAEAERTETVQGQKARRRFQLRGCFAAKAVAVVLIFLTVAVCVAGAAVIYIAAEERMYSRSYSEVMQDVLSGQARSLAYVAEDHLRSGYGYGEELCRYLDGRNAEVAVLKPEDMHVADSSVFLWQSYTEEEAMAENGFYSAMYEDVPVSLHLPAESLDGVPAAGGAEGEEEVLYTVRVFIDPRLEQQDKIREVARIAEVLYRFRYTAYWICGGAALLLAACIIFLLCGAGHRNGREGIVPGFLTGIPFDVLVLGMMFVLYLTWYIAVEYLYHISELLEAAVMCISLLVMALLFLWDLAIRLKLGKPWRHTVVYAVLRLLKRGLRAMWRLVKGIPLVWTTVAAYLAVCLLEVLWIARFTRLRNGGGAVWCMEKAVLFAVVLYIALVCRKLLKASRELAAGNEDYRVDTKYMTGDFLEHGENLNSIGQGVSRAVAEKMKSERLKTELISNVSHDLKTPLTSIINYAELIGREETENAVMKEYAEVLLRQSGRLKRLLENLVEASKAVTGSLEVDLQPCEAGVLLSQAVGEYQHRMEERGLDLRVSQPEEPVRILADGRHLWRVFDNLLNNICKYAQEGSRVYLNLEQREGKAFVIFRNMSGYALDVSPQELEERFVRGDKSRHMEGNGLGLSIAKSLTELQKGQMEIVIDGDLFKVTLSFDALPPVAE